MPIKNDYSSLTREEIEAVELAIPEPTAGEKKETIEEYLTRIGAGQSAIDSYVEFFKTARQTKMAESVPALIDANIDADLVVRLAKGYAAASPEARTQVEKLLLG